MHKVTTAYSKESAYDATKESTFRDWVRDDPRARFRPAHGRYHLYVMRGCPWAHRTLIVRALKGLEDAIEVTAVHYHMVEEEGWAFSADEPDPLHGLSHLRELYALANPAFKARPTVPVLWDKQERTIVNNESSEIVRMLGSEFNAFARMPRLDLYPVALRPEIDRWNQLIQDTVNRGVYRAGFATNQADYDDAVAALFIALDQLESHLSTHRFLVGAEPTEADWRLFPTLLRFDWVYHGLFKCNVRRLIDHANLFAYTRDLYQWPGVAGTVDEHHIRAGYHTSMRRLNPAGIVPAGPNVDYTAPHGRA
jgi:glutathionyl-hydroquinone reductase